jgi:hypothetical protein
MKKSKIVFVLLTALLLTSFFNKLDAQIISDINKLNITGIKITYINFNFERSLKFVVSNEKELAFIKEIKLPYNFDKTYQFHTSLIRNTGIYYSGIEVNNFEAYKLNSNTKIKYSKSEKRIKSVLFENDKFGTFLDLIYSTDDVNIGDTVQINYSYTLPYNENIGELTNFRVFFNDEIDKEYFKLILTHDKNLNINISTANLSKTEELNTESNLISYSWSEDNLKGSLLEKNAIEYKTSPYISISCIPRAFYYTLRNSTQSIPRPLYSLAAQRRESNFTDLIRAISIGSKNSQHIKLRKFISENTSEIINDSTGIEKITALHNYVVDNFKYQNDFNFYDEYDNDKERLGDFVSKKIIRERSRHSLYIAFTKILEINSFTGYLVDKRSGVLSKNYISPMFKDDYLIIPALKDNSIRYILPPKDGLAYYVDELPFYYENTTVRLVHQLDYLTKYESISENFNSVPTPNSTLKDNKRSHTTMVDINTSTGNAVYNSKINLSGQYSTLTRQIYNTTNKIDHTINPLYGVTQWQNIGTQRTAIEQVKSETKFPYKANFKATFSKDKAFQIENDQFTYTLKGHFNYIIDTTLNSKRILSYYPDFLSFDSYNYFLKLDSPLTLKNPISKTIENKLGKFVVDISQVAPNVIKLTSLFVINHEEVKAEDFNSVLDINNEIKKLNEYELKFSK